MFWGPSLNRMGKGKGQLGNSSTHSLPHGPLWCEESASRGIKLKLILLTQLPGGLDTIPWTVHQNNPDWHLVTVIRKVVATVTKLTHHIQMTFSWVSTCLAARTFVSSAEDSCNFTVRVLLFTRSVFLWRNRSWDLLSPLFLLSWSLTLTSLGHADPHP